MELATSLPELRLIVDHDLRRKVSEIWEYVLEARKIEITDLDRLPFTTSIANCELTFLAHKRLLLRLADSTIRNLGASLPNVRINRDRIIAGVMLIDIGKLLDHTAPYQNLHHISIGLDLAAKFQIPPGVSHIVASHSKASTHQPSTIEAIIVRHLDLLTYSAAQVRDNNQ